MDQSEEMFNLVRQWRKSGLSQSEFCKPHGIKVAKFGYWVGKEKLVEKGAGFVRISSRCRSALSSDWYGEAPPAWMSNPLFLTAELSQLFRVKYF